MTGRIQSPVCMPMNIRTEKSRDWSSLPALQWSEIGVRFFINSVHYCFLSSIFSFFKGLLEQHMMIVPGTLAANRFLRVTGRMCGCLVLYFMLKPLRCGLWCPHWSLLLSSLVYVRPLPPPYRRFGWPLVGPYVLA